jgi:hypothetical protein
MISLVLHFNDFRHPIGRRDLRLSMQKAQAGASEDDTDRERERHIDELCHEIAPVSVSLLLVASLRNLARCPAPLKPVGDSHNTATPIA